MTRFNLKKYGKTTKALVVVVAGATKNNILTVEGTASSLRPLQRELLPFNNNNKRIYLPNALRVDKRNRSPLSSNLLEPFPPIM